MFYSKNPMSKRKIYQFLRDLTKNNSKEWMDANRSYYQEAKGIWVEEVEAILQRLSQHDSSFAALNPKRTIMRINNNRMFHPDRPIYKDNFAFSPTGKDAPALYVHVSPSESFLGGGIYRPESKILKQIRAGIDFDGERLQQIIDQKSFQDFFGGLSEDPEMLKTSPKGYSVEHQNIELLRRKSFAALRPFSQAEFIADDFVDLVEQAYLELKPLNDYFAQAMSVDA